MIEPKPVRKEYCNMKKQMIAMILVSVLLTALTPALLAAPPAEDVAAKALAALDVMVGDERGDLMLARAVTRAEFTKMVLSMSARRDSVGAETSVSPYPDVPNTHWAAAYVEAAVQAGYVTGYLDGTFRPGRTITLAEGVTMALRLLGYADQDFSGVYPSGQMALCRTLNLNEGVAASADTQILTRKDAMYLLYNLLTASTKSGAVYLSTLGYPLTGSGEVDLVALINDAMEGPLVAAPDWQTAIPFSLDTAAVYRSGDISSPSSIQTGDMLYWSKSMRTVWAYTAKVTGTYQAASPSLSAPATVTVAGKSYAIETASAAFVLSNLGSFSPGDTVTLLLGRGGGVAAVQAAGQTSSILYGVVGAVGSARYSDASGNVYTASTVTFTATDGLQYTYQSGGSSFSAGDLIQVSAASGAVSVKRLSGNPLTGRVNSAGTKLGSYTLADHVEILDTFEGSALRIYPPRLAGIDLQGSMVRCYTLNARGELNRLILNDVTGDLRQYGVVTAADEMSGGMAVMSSYAYDIGGVTGFYTSGSSAFGVSVGPCRFTAKDGKISSIANLFPVKLTAVGGNTAVGSFSSYTLSDAVLVYEIAGGEYLLSSLDRVASNYSLTGWYDKAESAGGRIRVIVAIPVSA